MKKSKQPKNISDRMIAEKLAASTIQKNKDYFINKCNEDLLRMEVSTINQSLGFMCWVLHSHFRCGTKRLGSLLDETYSALKNLKGEIARQKKTGAEYIQSLLDDIKKNLQISIRNVEKGQNIGIIFGDENCYVKLVKEEQWKQTQWCEEPVILTSWKFDKNLSRATPRHISMAKTIVEGYTVQIDQKLRKYYSSHSSKDTRTLQNLVMGIVCQSLSNLWHWKPEKLDDFIQKLYLWDEKIGTLKTGKKKSDLDIPALVQKLKEKTNIEIIIPLNDTDPVQIGNYSLRIKTSDGEVEWLEINAA